MSGPPPEPPTPSLRHNRDFTVLWAGEAVSELGTAMTTLVIPVIGYAVTGSTTQAGLAVTASFVAGLVARLPAGVLVDRVSRRRVLVAGNLAGAALYAVLAVTAATGTLTLPLLVAVAAGNGIVSAVYGPAVSAAVRTVVPAEHRPLAYSRLQIRGHAANLVGPPLGGALYSAARSLPFAFDALSFALAAASTRLLRADLGAPDGPRRSVLQDLRGGLAFLWRQSAVRALMMWGGLVNLATTYVFVTVTLRLVARGVHPAAIGLIESVAAVAGVVGALVAPRIIQATPTGRMTLGTGSIVAVAFAAMATTSSVLGLGALLAAATFLLPANNAGISAYIASVVPDQMQGRFNAAAGLVAEGLLPIGPVLAGLLLAHGGSITAALVGGGLAVASLLPLVLTSSLRTLGRPSTWTHTEAPMPD